MSKSAIPKYRLKQAQRRQERLLLLGEITHNWNFLEYQVAYLTSLYTLDEEATYSIASRLRNAEATTALLQLVREREHRVRIISAVEFAVSAFHRLRENRNVLVHSHHVFEITGKHVLWTRRSKTNPNNMVMILGTIRNLRKIAADIARLQAYFSGLIAFTHYESSKHMAETDEFIREVLKKLGPRPPLPKRFPLPRKLEETPPSPPRAAPRLRP